MARVSFPHECDDKDVDVALLVGTVVLQALLVGRATVTVVGYDVVGARRLEYVFNFERTRLGSRSS